MLKKLSTVSSCIRSWAGRRIGRRILLLAAPIIATAMAATGFFALGTTQIKHDLGKIVEHNQPLSAAAFELEFNINGIALGVANYLHSADPRFRQSVSMESENFRHFHRTVMEQARDEAIRAAAESGGRLYEEFLALADQLLDLKDREQGQFGIFVALVAELDTIAQQIAEQDPAAVTESDRIFTKIYYRSAQAALWLAGFVGIADTMALDQFKSDRTVIRNLVARARDPGRAGPLPVRALGILGKTDTLLDTMDDIVAIDLQLREKFAAFIALRHRLDDLLNEDIQIRVHDMLNASNEKATRFVAQSYLLLAVAFFLVVTTTVSAFRLTRTWLLGPIEQLMDGVRRIESGDHDHRFKPQGEDEITALAASLDRMLDELSRAQSELRSVNENLEKTVRERTQNISALNRELEQELGQRQTAEAALTVARDEAEAASHAKSEFLANMSHELRTPLNAIIGFSELMKNEVLGPMANEKYKSYVGDILSSGTHLLNIINDILDLAKIEAGKLTLDDSEAECLALVKDSIRLANPDTVNKDIRLDVVDKVGDLIVRVDKTKFKRALINLLSNAYKFTPAGGGVTVAVARAQDGGVAFSVADTGIGIPADKIATALAPFGQVESVLSRKHQGTGLGLPLTKSLMEMHGGTLALDSVEGKGTTVTLTLPAQRVVEKSRSRRNA